VNNCDRISSRKSTLAKLLAFISISLAYCNNCASVQGQIVPDNTLGNERSQVRTNVNIKDLPAELIEGGAQREANLFHSFSQFNIEAGQGAYFANPEGIANIFSRVTGGNVSEIMGKLGVQGSADLFLLNPNGIIFGENSSLDVNGSFVGSSADSIVFDDGFEFSAVNPEPPALLTINQPLGLNLDNSPGEIVNNSVTDNVGLQVLPGKNISLIGGNINLDRGLITAPEGKVELSGLAAAGLIAIEQDSSFSFPQEVARADVTLTDGASVNVSADDGGFINITANNLNLAGESALVAGIAEDSGSSNAQAGDITINANNDISLSESSGIQNRVNLNGIGDSGKIQVSTNTLNLTDNSFLSTSTLGQGNSGNIIVDAQGNIARYYSPS
jgi:filamentous hemagglutinin family protein